MDTLNNSETLPQVKIVLGTALFGDISDPQVKFNTPADARIILDIFRARGYTEIDTARGYPVGAPGTSEKLLGTLNQGNWMKLDTKVVSREEISPSPNSCCGVTWKDGCNHRSANRRRSHGPLALIRM